MFQTCFGTNQLIPVMADRKQMLPVAIMPMAQLKASENSWRAWCELEFKKLLFL